MSFATRLTLALSISTAIFAACSDASPLEDADADLRRRPDAGVDARAQIDTGKGKPDPGLSLPAAVDVTMGHFHYKNGSDQLERTPCTSGASCFVVRLTDPWQIRTAIQRLRQQSKSHVLGGTLRLSPAPYNVDEKGHPWSWHIESAGLSSRAPEMCDTGPEFLETAVREGKLEDGHGVCFWSFDVHAVTHDGGISVSSTADGPTDCGDTLPGTDCEAHTGCQTSFQDASLNGEVYVCADAFSLRAPKCPRPGDHPFACEPKLLHF